VGQQHRSALGSTYQQEVDTAVLFKDACAYLATVTVPEQVPMVVDRAVRTALAERAPTAVIVPHDVQALEMPDEAPRRHGAMVTSVGVDLGTVLPSEGGLDDAAALLRAADRPALLVGRGAARAVPEVLAIADRLGAGIATSLLGKPVLDEDLPHVCGCIGHLGTDAAQNLMDGCDTLLMVGTNDPWTEFLPAPGQARAVQIDIDGRHVGMRYPTEVNLVGDAGPTLARLTERLGPGDGGANTTWRHQVERWVEDWHRELERRALEPGVPLNPQLVFHELAPRVSDDALVAVDVGSVTYWYSRYLRLHGRIAAHLSSTLASMGSALPYGLAAKLEHPDRPVLALVGDGAMQMNGLAEMITAAKYRHQWEDPRLVVGVWNNHDLNQVTWEMRAMEGAPSFLPSQEIPDVQYAAFARSLGLTGVRVEKPQDVEAGWRAGLEADGPAVIEFLTDPAVPPIPPHATWEQLEATAASVLKGDFDRTSMVRQGFKAKLQEFLPGGDKS
jgi:pyruvate dehydrogenase (quinone)